VGKFGAIWSEPPDFFQKVSNEVPSGHMSSEPLGFFHKMPSEVPNRYFLYKPPEFFHKILKNVTKMYSTIYPMSSLRVYGKIELHWEFIMGTLQRTHQA
jgi:hypothetical protein